MKQSFLKKIDVHLLKNNPVTWSSRVHMAAFYGSIFLLSLVLLCFIVPDDPRQPSQVHNWIVLISIVSLLAFVFWMIYLLRFNVFKRFGKWDQLDTAKTFLFYFLITLLIVSWPFVPPIVQSIRAGLNYSADEMINDVNQMNTRICQLEKDSINKRFSVDTLELNNSVKGTILKEVYHNEAEGVANNGNYYFADSTTIRLRLLESDSTKKLSDSVYVFYECPDYQFVQYYSYRAKSKIGILPSIDLFRQVIRDKTPFDQNVVKKELGQLFVKYSKYHDVQTLSVNQFDDDYVTDIMSRIRDKYDLYYVNSAIDNIVAKKYRWDKDTIDLCWRVAYYTALFLSLLVLIFRHTTRRTFFLSLLAAVVLAMLTGLFLATTHSPNGGAFFIWIIFYFIGFALIAAMIVNSSYRNVVSGIALNLLVFITAFMPLVITGLYYSILRDRYDRSQQFGYQHLFRNEGFHYFLSEIAGFVLLVVLLATIYRAAFRKWFALPDQ